MSFASTPINFLQNTVSFSKPVSCYTTAPNVFAYSKAELYARIAIVAAVSLAATAVACIAFGTFTAPILFVVSLNGVRKYRNYEQNRAATEQRIQENMNKILSGNEYDPACYEGALSSLENFQKFINDPQFKPENHLPILLQNLLNTLSDNRYEFFSSNREKSKRLCQDCFEALLNKKILIPAKDIYKFIEIDPRQHLSIIKRAFENNNVFENNNIDLSQFDKEALSQLIHSAKKALIRDGNSPKFQLLRLIVECIKQSEELSTMLKEIIQDAIDDYAPLPKSTGGYEKHSCYKFIHALVAAGWDVELTPTEDFRHQILEEAIQKGMNDRPHNLPQPIPEELYEKNPIKIHLPAVDISKGDYHFCVDEAQLTFRTSFLSIGVFFILLHLSVPVIPLFAATVLSSTLYNTAERNRAMRTLFNIAINQLESLSPQKSVGSFVAKDLNVLTRIRDQNVSLLQKHNYFLIERLLAHSIGEPESPSVLGERFLPQFRFILSLVKDNLTPQQKYEYFHTVLKSGLTPIIDEFVKSVPGMDVLHAEISEEQQFNCWCAVKNLQSIELLTTLGFNPNAK